MFVHLLVWGNGEGHSHLKNYSTELIKTDFRDHTFTIRYTHSLQLTSLVRGILILFFNSCRVMDFLTDGQLIDL